MVPAIRPTRGGNGDLRALADHRLALAGRGRYAPTDLVVDMHQRSHCEHHRRIAVEQLRRQAQAGAGVLGKQRQRRLDQRLAGEAETLHQPRAGAALGWMHSVLEDQRFLDRLADGLADQLAGTRVVSGAAQRAGTSVARDADGNLVGAGAGRQAGRIA